MMLRNKFATTSYRVPNGTTGLFIAASGTGTSEYQFGNDTLTPSTSFPLSTLTTGNTSVLNIPAYSLAARFTSAALVTYKYTYSNKAISVGTSLVSSGVAVAAGNSTIGIMQPQVSTFVTNRYTYATNAMAAGAALAYGTGSLNGGGMGWGSATTAYLPKYASGKLVASYTYATDTSAPANVLVQNSNGNSATSTPTFGFIIGLNVNFAYKHTYSSDTYALAASAFTTVTVGSINPAGNADLAIVATQLTTSNRYIYATDSSLAGATWTAGNSKGLAGSNGVLGVNA